MSELICGLDIGTSKISVILGQFKEPNKLIIMRKAKLASEGIERGKVLDMEKFTQVIERVMQSVEADKTLRPTRIILGVGNELLRIQHYRRTIIISERSQEIKNSHIERLIKETMDTVVPFDYETLHVLSKEFIVDGQEKIRDPRGMFGNRLSGDFLVMFFPSSTLYNLKKGVYNAGYEVDRVFFSGYTTAFSFLDEEERNEGVIFLKIGGGTTTLAKFSGGIPVFFEIFPFGGIDIDYALSKALGVSLEEAKKIKEKYGGLENRKEKIISEVSLKEFSQEQLIKIVKDVLERFLLRIKRKMAKFYGLDKVPFGIVLAGETFLLEGLVEKVEEIFRIPARLGVIKNIEDLTNKEENLFTYSDPIGLLRFDYLHRSSSKAIEKKLNSLRRFMLFAKKLFEEYF